ncbi:[NiFe]-hydrogenase assembly chaperone HybE, partial [Salmonella enterica]|uniref:[NiFe]-hydrogenase assembly chaperone HybE n=1 Tax=Salmonella enterica TaxID=28901 RepID=UPI00398C3FDD
RLRALHCTGPGQTWHRRTVGEKRGVQRPYGTRTFTVGGREGGAHDLACSLMWPLSRSLSPEEGVRLAEDCARMLLSLPVSNPDAPRTSRRELLFGRRGCENA